MGALVISQGSTKTKANPESMKGQAQKFDAFFFYFDPPLPWCGTAGGSCSIPDFFFQMERNEWDIFATFWTIWELLWDMIESKMPQNSDGNTTT